MTPNDALPRPRRQLSLRLLGYILLASSAVTLLLSVWQLWADYEHDVRAIEDRFAIVEKTTLDPLSSSVWTLNEEQINLLLSGMLNLEAVSAVELQTDQGQHYRFGQVPAGGAPIVRSYRLSYRGDADADGYPLGTLTLHASLDAVYARLVDRAANILVGQALKTFIVSAFILLIVQQLVTRHLGTIADYARSLSLTTLDRPLQLARQGRTSDEPDELDRVEHAINYMRETLAQDITQREAAERQLLQSEARYRQLFDSSTDGLAIFDLDGSLLSANPAFLALVGRTLADARNLTLAGLTPPRWHAEDARLMREQVLARGYSDVHRKELVRRDGSAVPVEVRSWTVRDDHGRPQFLMTTVRDIGRELTLESEREQLQRHRQEAQRLETIGTLAGGIAHEFNNLLTPIRGYAEMLAHDAEPGSAARSRAEAIFHAAERGRKLVDKILLFGRRGQARRIDTDIVRIIRETLELALLDRPAGIRIETRCEADDGSLVADPAQLHQALMNLVINAFEAMRDGGELLVAVREARRADADGLEVSVHDNGPGLPESTLAHLFEPFHATRGNGQGMGLAVVHGIVLAHGGDIRVDSGDDGTTFTLWLPRKQAG